MKVTESRLSDFSFFLYLWACWEICPSMFLFFCIHRWLKWWLKVIFLSLYKSQSPKALEIFVLKSSVSPYLPPRSQQVLANARKTQKLFISPGWKQEKYPIIPQKVCKTSVKHSVSQTSWDTPLSSVFCWISSNLLSCSAWDAATGYLRKFSRFGPV